MFKRVLIVLFFLSGVYACSQEPTTDVADIYSFALSRYFDLLKNHQDSLLQSKNPSDTLLLEDLNKLLKEDVIVLNHFPGDIEIASNRPNIEIQSLFEFCSQEDKNENQTVIQISYLTGSGPNHIVTIRTDLLRNTPEQCLLHVSTLGTTKLRFNYNCNQGKYSFLGFGESN